MTVDEERRRALFVKLELVGLFLVLAAALVPRVRDFRAPFDREFEGAQGAFFAIGAINYERLGLWRVGGYPVINIDLGDREDAVHRIWDHPEAWYVYPNHPPLVPLVAWASLKAFAPEDWNGAWHEARAPSGIEPVLRLPFLIAHILGLIAFWWAVREAAGARRAMLALALLAALPVSVIYATLVNYENPALLFVFLSLAFYARYRKRGRRSDLIGLGASFFGGACVTYAPLFFLPPIVVHACMSREWRKAMLVAITGGVAAAVPIGAHVLWSRHALESIGHVPADAVTRAMELWAPLLDGSHPAREWIALQAARWWSWFTPSVAVLALIGLALATLSRWSPRARARLATSDDASSFDPGVLLFAGGATACFAFYRHTLDPQYPFLMFVGPGAAALAATALDAASPMLFRLRAGVAPLVLVTCTIALLCVQRFNALRFEFRARPGEHSPSGIETPQLPPPDVAGRELALLLPAGSFVVVPSHLGLNLAASFYAWRSLWPIEGPQDAFPFAVARSFGLGLAPHYLALPYSPPSQATAQVDALRTGLVHEALPTVQSESWAAWLLH